MSRTYGTLVFEKGEWKVTVEPHVMIKLKSLFSKINKREHGTVTLQNTLDTCRDLEWFISRYPLVLDEVSRVTLLSGSQLYQERQERLEMFRRPDYKPAQVNLALPLRDYQLVGVHMFINNGFLLLGDDVGLGKTPTALGALDSAERLPALIVCQTHLTRQWAQEQAPKFLPGIRTHIIKQNKHYDLPPADIYVITYHKLAAWTEYFTQTLVPKVVIYDEMQELRLPGSGKYCAAQRLAEVIPMRQGLTATPIYNYGDEIFNVIDLLQPGVLGDRDEFEREWCYKHGSRTLVKDTKAFGAYLREAGIMLARKRKEVGRELPPVTRVTEIIPHDHKPLDDIKSSALGLAQLILSGTFEERGQASRELNLKLRQATGVGKAPHVADFVRMLAERPQKVLVFAWHREVYRILQEKLADFRPVLYTGTETAAQKHETKLKFMKSFDEGGSDVCLMSLRAGSGLDGLQDVCDVCVYAELDWSPQVHHQDTGRLARDRTDGTFNQVTEVYLVSDAGSDPVVADILGLKSSQSLGIMSPDSDVAEGVEIDPERMKRLATEYLQKNS